MDNRTVTFTINQLAVAMCTTHGQAIGIQMEDIVEYVHDNAESFITPAEQLYTQQLNKQH